MKLVSAKTHSPGMKGILSNNLGFDIAKPLRASAQFDRIGKNSGHGKVPALNDKVFGQKQKTAAFSVQGQPLAGKESDMFA